MKLFTTLSLSLALCSSLGAQEWVRQHPNAFIGQMYDVEMSTSGFGVAAGADGFLMTSDFGENWDNLELGINPYSITDIALIPDGTQHSMLIFSGSNMWRTTDAGESWEELTVDEGPFGYIGILDVPDPSTYIVGGNQGTLISADAGDTWQNITPTDTLQWNSMDFVSATHGWAGSTTGEIFRTTDGGTTWNLINTQYTENVYLSFIDENVGYAAIRKILAKTEDGGETWTAINETAFGSHIRELRIMTEDWMVAAQGNRVYTTTDGGVTMEIIFPVAYVSQHQGICPLPDGRVWSAGSYGTIGFSSDQGFTYVDQLYANKNQLYFVDFTDFDHGWAAGYNGAVLKTSDGGTTWEDVSDTDVLSSSILRGHAASAQELWLTGASGLFRTTDGGQSWENVYAGSSFFFDMLKEGDEIYLTGGDQKLHRSLDGGLSWEVIDVGSSETIEAIYRVNAQVLYLGGQQGTVFKTTDGGASWTTTNTPTDKNIGDLFFHNEMDGWLVIKTWGMEAFHTTDGGNTWEAITTASNHPKQHIYFTDELTGYLVGGSSFSGIVMQTLDGGATWEYLHVESLSATDMVTVLDENRTRHWVVGQAGSIFSLDLNVNRLGGSPNVEVLHCFPNPTAGITQLRVPKTLSPDAILLVHDAQGRMLQQQPWTDGRLDLSRFASGTYFIQIFDDGQQYVAQVVKP